jgi:similar to stage IV sporulation protein
VTIKILTSFLKGAVRVEVSGKNPERLVNLCLDNGIPIWDLRSQDGKVYLTMPLKHYLSIRPIARRAKCVSRVRRRMGLPFFIAKTKRRQSFLLACMLAMVVFMYVSGSVWGIRVKGAYSLDDEEIIKSAESYGLKVGARKSTVSTKDVEAGLIRDIPQLSWAYVHFQGSLAVIELVEKVRPDAPLPGDVVASREGLVTSVLVLSGTPVVKVGQTVKKGDLLIVGNSQDGIEGARGSVMAKTWYEVYREVSLCQSKPVRTGRKSEATVVRVKNREIFLPTTSYMFEWYEVEEYPKAKMNLPYLGEVSAFNLVMYEINWEERSIAQEEARQIAEKQVLESLRRQLPSTAEMVDLSCEVETAGADMLAFRFVACVIEDIGEVQAWP